MYRGMETDPSDPDLSPHPSGINIRVRILLGMCIYDDNNIHRKVIIHERSSQVYVSARGPNKFLVVRRMVKYSHVKRLNIMCE